MAKLDVLVPHYNDPEGLILSLRSIVRQRWKGDKRVIIVDDGSAPLARKAAHEIVEDYQNLKPEDWDLKIDFVQNDVNRGRPFTRNVLLDAIESPYVAWLDAGDEWYPSKLAAQFDLVEIIEASHTNKLIWVTCNYDWCWSGGKKRKIKQNVNQDQHKGLLIGSSLRAYLWTLLGSAESFKCVGYFDEGLPRMQDLDYFIRFVSHGGTIRNLEGDNTHCVYHKSDEGRNADEIRACNAVIYDKHRVIFNRYGDGFRQMRLFNMDMLAARFAQNNKDLKKKRFYMFSAFKHRPWAFIKHVKKKGFAL